MCRWTAYKGQSIYIEDWLLNSEHSLIEQSKSADLTKYEVNGDGFGIGWYGQKPEPGLFKSIRPAASGLPLNTNVSVSRAWATASCKSTAVAAGASTMGPENPPTGEAPRARKRPTRALATASTQLSSSSGVKVPNLPQAVEQARLKKASVSGSGTRRRPTSCTRRRW